MPSDRKQINVRADAETEELMNRLIPAVSAAIGLKVNQSDLFRLGLIALRKQYLPEDEKPSATPANERQAAEAARILSLNGRIFFPPHAAAGIVVVRGLVFVGAVRSPSACHGRRHRRRRSARRRSADPCSLAATDSGRSGCQTWLGAAGIRSRRLR